MSDEEKKAIKIIKNIKKLVEIEWKHYITDIELKAIETLLTAYEKEKGENVKLRLQDIPLIEGELKAYKDRVNELKAELEKEKEKNKKLFNQLNYIHECFCKFNWKESSGEQVYIQLKELYKSIFGGIKQC